MTVKSAEVFAGIAGFRYGIEQATDQIQTVWANELDKYAAAVYRFRYGEGEIVEQDIAKINTSAIPDFDLLTGGFPCQSFSVAGERRGFDDTRGNLFFEVARILADKRPRYFLLENVKGLASHDSGKTLQTILGVLARLGYRDIQWCVLNSTCFVPQNRERIFIVGHLGERGRPEIFPLPEDGSLYSGSLGQDSVANCLDSNCWKGRLDKGQRTMVAEIAYTKSNRKDSCVEWSDPANNLDSGASQAVALYHTAFQGGVRVYKDEAPTISTPVGGGHLPYVGVKVSGGGFSDNLICGEVSPTLMGCANTGGNHQSGISRRNPIVPIGLTRTRSTGNYKETDATPVLRQSYKWETVVGLPNRFRRLTPVECERLQGFEDGWTALGLFHNKKGELVPMPISDTQRYRMCGNAVTTDVISAIIRKMVRVWF